MTAQAPNQALIRTLVKRPARPRRFFGTELLDCASKSTNRLLFRTEEASGAMGPLDEIDHQTLIRQVGPKQHLRLPPICKRRHSLWPSVTENRVECRFKNSPLNHPGAEPGSGSRSCPADRPHRTILLCRTCGALNAFGRTVKTVRYRRCI